MTKDELEQYRSIVARMDDVRDRINKNAACDTVRGSDAQFPYTAHTIKVIGVVDEPTLPGKVQKDMILLRGLEVRKKAIEDFINSIPDNLTQWIFKLRYIEGDKRPSWQRIAFKVSKGMMSADAIRKIVTRYLKN